MAFFGAAHGWPLPILNRVNNKLFWFIFTLDFYDQNFFEFIFCERTRKQNIKTFCFTDFFFHNSFCFSVVQLSFCVCVYNLYRCSSKKTCRWYLLFLWKTALTTIVTLWTSIIFFRGKLSSEWNLIFIYFSSESTEFFVIDLFI